MGLRAARRMCDYKTPQKLWLHHALKFLYSHIDLYILCSIIIT